MPELSPHLLQDAVNKLREQGNVLSDISEAATPNFGLMRTALSAVKSNASGNAGPKRSGIIGRKRGGGASSKPNPNRRAAPAVNGQPGKPSVQPANQGGTSIPDSTVDSRMPNRMPEPGKGIIRRNRTGRTTAIDTPPSEGPATGNAQPRESDNNQGLYQTPQAPDLALATDVDTLPAFLQQLTGAQQTNLRNRTGQANRRGIIAKQRAQQDLKAGDIETQQAGLELEQSQELDSVLDELGQLDQSSDPDGTRRRQLMDTALTLQGKQPSSDFQFKTVQDQDQYGMPVQRLVRINKGTGEYNIIGAAPASGQAGGGAGGQGGAQGAGARSGGQSGGGTAGGPPPTQAELEFTAQKHGMTVDQVKQALGIQ